VPRAPLALALGAGLLAAAPSPRAQAAPDTSARVATPLVRISGSVRAETVRHVGRVGHVRARLLGNAPDTLVAVERANLPRPVRPEVTYEDVRVTFDVVSGLPELEGWLRRTLGAAADSTRPPPPRPPPPRR
jgi:hypothetical protein